MAGSYDLVIRNGKVVDGTGSPWRKKDIVIVNGHMAVENGSLTGQGPTAIIIPHCCGIDYLRLFFYSYYCYICQKGLSPCLHSLSFRYRFKF